MFAVEPHVSNEVEVRAVNTALTSFYIKVLGGHIVGIKPTLQKILLTSKVNHPLKKVVISYITEPMIFLNHNYIEDSLSWYELIHDICNELDFPKNQIEFVLGNIYAVESYNNWCKEYSIVEKINVKGLPNFYWLSRCIDKGYNKLFDVTPDKHLTCFIGRPRFQKNYIVKWYIENIQDTENENKILATILYKNISQSDSWFEQKENSDKIKKLPGRLEDGSTDHSNAWLNGNPDIFNKSSLRGLIDFIIDYVEFENIKNYDDYVKFKSERLWWHEDVLSEKLFVNILLKKPFIRLGMPSSLKRLQEWGFKTFDGILFDESYDDIENFYERANFILDQVNGLLNIPFDDLHRKVKSDQVQEILNHNYNLAYKIYNEKEELVNV